MTSSLQPLIDHLMSTNGVVTEEHPWPYTSHPVFRAVHNAIMERIHNEKSMPEIPGYSQIQHNTFREAQVQSAYINLMAQAKEHGIPVDVNVPKAHLRNKSNQLDVRRALIIEDCDDVSVALLDLIIIAHPANATDIVLFVQALQDARQFYLGLPNSPKDTPYSDPFSDFV